MGSTSTSPTITILPASQEDLPSMISITCAATEPDLLNHFLWSQDYRERIQKHTDSLTKSLGKRYSEPTNPCFLYKAVEQSTTMDESGEEGKAEEILGWCLVRWEDGSWLDSPLAEGETFVAKYGREVKGKWRGLMKGRGPHVVLGALYVKPERQRQGIGRRLIEFIDGKYDLRRETVIVQTRGMSEEFYQRLGWVTVDCTEIDLSEWGGEGRGYGVHRSPQMVRWPEGEKGGRYAGGGVARE